MPTACVACSLLRRAPTSPRPSPFSRNRPTCRLARRCRRPNSIVYADVWERAVFALEDPYLADAGLHGAETAFRTRTMVQLKAAPLAASPDIEAGTGDFPRIGTAELAVAPTDPDAIVDECDPCAGVVQLEQVVANALWRLEIVAVEGTPTAPDRIALAWSIENAAAIAPADVSHEDFERAGKVYEFFSPTTESYSGVFADSTDAKPSAFVDDLATAPDPPTDHDGSDWPFVRRWDGHAVIAGGAVESQLGAGYTIAVAGNAVTLTLDTFTATLDLAGKVVMAGDYWLVELRRFAAEDERIRLVSATPVGIEHHYCVLFRTNAAGTALSPTDAERRKLSFPTLADLPADHVGFVNNCPKLYDDAENVQEALDNLCAIAAEDIAFDPDTCPVLYNGATNVQDALANLCKVDFSFDRVLRLLMDWGVVCGLIPKLPNQGPASSWSAPARSSTVPAISTSSRAVTSTSTSSSSGRTFSTRTKAPSPRPSRKRRCVSPSPPEKRAATSKSSWPTRPSHSGRPIRDFSKGRPHASRPTSPSA